MHQAWVIDVKMKMPGRGVMRVRETSPINTRRGAQQYEHRLRAAVLDGSYQQHEAAVVPTFSVFLPRYLTYCSNNNKFSTFETKKRLIELHLAPYFGGMALDATNPIGLVPAAEPMFNDPRRRLLMTLHATPRLFRD